MEYALFITVDEAQVPDPASPDFGRVMAAWMAYNQQLLDGGHFVAGASLQPSSTATVLDLAAGSMTDGPFTETREQLAGFYVVSASDLDEALDLARALPVPARVEVRPLAFRPDALGVPTGAGGGSAPGDPS